jgi:D-xylose transport system ATP-binding protein
MQEASQDGSDAGESPMFSFLNIKKSYGSVEALVNGNLRIYPGRCHAIVGDNGAGKSTFLKVLSGAEIADSGKILGANGDDVRIQGPQDAMRLGIATVYQNLALAENRSVAENIFLGQEPTRWGIIQRKEMDQRSAVALRSITTRDIPIDVLVEKLSGGQRQAVAITRAVVDKQKKVILLDEPTAALGVQESRHVLEAITALRGQGLSLVMVSHSLAHVFQISDDITVFRHGRVVAHKRVGDTTPDQIIGYITGASVAMEEFHE